MGPVDPAASSAGADASLSASSGDATTRFAHVDAAAHGEHQGGGNHAAGTGAGWYWGWWDEWERVKKDIANLISHQIQPLRQEANSFQTQRAQLLSSAAAVRQQTSSYSASVANSRSQLPRETSAATAAQRDAAAAQDALNQANNKLREERAAAERALAEQRTTAAAAGERARLRAEVTRKKGQMAATLAADRNSLDKLRQQSQAKVGAEEASLAQRKRTLQVDEQGAKAEEVAMTTALERATKGRDGAREEQAASEAALKKAQEAVASKEAELKAAQAQVRAARSDATKTTREALDAAKRNRDAARDAVKAAESAVFDMTQEAKVESDAAARRKQEVEALLATQRAEAQKLDADVAVVRREQGAQEEKLRGEAAKREEATVASEKRLGEAQAAYRDLLAKHAVEQAARQAQMAALMSRVATVKHALLATLNMTRAGHRALRADRRRLEGQLAAAHATHDATVEESATLARRLANETATAERAIRDIQAARVASEEEFKTAVAGRRAEVAAAEAAVAVAVDRRNKMEQQLAVQRADAERQVRSQRAAIAEDVAAQEREAHMEDRRFMAQASEARAAVAVARHEVDALTSRKAEASMALEGVTRELAVRQRELDGVEADRAALSDAVAGLRQKKGELEASIAEVGGKTEQGRGEQRLADATLTDALDGLRKAEAVVAGLEARRDAASGAVEKAEKRLKEAGSAHTALSEEVERMRTVKATVVQLAEGIAAATKRLEAADTTKAVLQRQLLALQGRKEELEATVAVLQQRIDTRKAAANVATGSNEELKTAELALRKAAEAATTASHARVAQWANETSGMKRDMAASLQSLALALKAVRDDKSSLDMQYAAESARAISKAKAEAAELTAQAEKVRAAKAQAGATHAANTTGVAPGAPAPLTVEASVASLSRVVGDKVHQLQAALASLTSARADAHAAAAWRPASAGVVSTGPPSPPVVQHKRIVFGDAVHLADGRTATLAALPDTLDRPVVAPAQPAVEGAPTLYGNLPDEIVLLRPPADGPTPTA